MAEASRALRSASHLAFISAIDSSTTQVRFWARGHELKNCAHATIATQWRYAGVTGQSTPWRNHQVAPGGKQEVVVESTTALGLVRLRQNPTRIERPDPQVAKQVLATLRLETADLDPNLELVSASPGTPRFLVPLRSQDVLRSLAPHFAALRDLCRATGSIGAFAFCLEGDDTACGRMFAPAIGVDEDAVNGNSAGCLAAYLLEKRGPTQSRHEVAVEQGLAVGSRGRVEATADWDDGLPRSWIRGLARALGEHKVGL